MSNIIGVNIDYKTVIVASLVGAGAVWVAKKTIENGLEKLQDALPGVVPDGGEVYDDNHGGQYEGAPGAELVPNSFFGFLMDKITGVDETWPEWYKNS